MSCLTVGRLSGTNAKARCGPKKRLNRTGSGFVLQLSIALHKRLLLVHIKQIMLRIRRILVTFGIVRFFYFKVTLCLNLPLTAKYTKLTILTPHKKSCGSHCCALREEGEAAASLEIARAARVELGKKCKS